jgi:hypothetical protein
MVTFQLQDELLDIVLYQCDHPALDHLYEEKKLAETARTE